MDGSNRKILTTQSEYREQINHIALDRSKQIVFWSASGTHTIWRIDYNGKLKSVALNRSIEAPDALNLRALATFESKLFWVEVSRRDSSIRMAPIDNLAQNELIISSDAYISGYLTVFSDRIQSGENPCMHSNGGCAQFCFFNGTHPVCACAHGEIASDGKTCVPFDEFLIYSDSSSIHSIQLTNNVNMKTPILEIKDPKLFWGAYALSYSYEKKRIFFSDQIDACTINWVHFNGSDYRKLVIQKAPVAG